jgi:hypothetical protein
VAVNRPAAQLAEATEPTRRPAAGDGHRLPQIATCVPRLEAQSWAKDIGVELGRAPFGLKHRAQLSVLPLPRLRIRLRRHRTGAGLRQRQVVLPVDPGEVLQANESPITGEQRPSSNAVDAVAYDLRPQTAPSPGAFTVQRRSGAAPGGVL